MVGGSPEHEELHDRVAALRRFGIAALEQKTRGASVSAVHAAQLVSRLALGSCTSNCLC